LDEFENSNQAPELSFTRENMAEFGQYRILEKIAGGGMAEIYRVEDPQNPSEVFALKLIRPDLAHEPDFREMLLDEARIAGRLDHRNIARVLKLIENDGELGLLLEHVDGVDLIRVQQTLRERKRELSLEAALLVLLDTLDGLHYAHDLFDDEGEQLNIVHRDVSPGNIMVETSGHIRIVDWGIAGGKKRKAQTETGQVKGKFRYMAPEQIMGEPAVRGTDIYSASATFWELLAGERIYGEIELTQLMMKVSKGEMPGLEKARTGLPRALISVFRKATSLVPDRRYSSAAKYAAALRALRLIHNEEKARAELSRVATNARVKDGKRGYARAVEKVRFISAEYESLESALLRALETPDRVEVLDLSKREIIMAEATARSDFIARGPGQSSTW